MFKKGLIDNKKKCVSDFWQRHINFRDKTYQYRIQQLPVVNVDKFIISGQKVSNPKPQTTGQQVCIPDDLTIPPQSRRDSQWVFGEQTTLLVSSSTVMMSSQQANSRHDLSSNDACMCVCVCVYSGAPPTLSVRKTLESHLAANHQPPKLLLSGCQRFATS